MGNDPWDFTKHNSGALLIKRIQGGLVSIKNKDSKWGELLITAMFMGMISAFMGMVFKHRKGLPVGSHIRYAVFSSSYGSVRYPDKSPQG